MLNFSSGRPHTCLCALPLTADRTRPASLIYVPNWPQGTLEFLTPDIDGIGVMVLMCSSQFSVTRLKLGEGNYLPEATKLLTGVGENIISYLLVPFLPLRPCS